MTISQKRSLQKAAALSLCGGLVICCFLSVPRIAAAIPASFVDFFNMSAPEEPLHAMGAESTLLWEESTVSRPEEESEEARQEDNLWEPESSESPEVSDPLPPEEAITVLADSFCWYEPGETPTLDLINGTSFRVDPAEYLQKRFPIPTPTNTSQQPLVLIMHTHGTESYLPNGVEYYLPDEDFRSENPEETVIAVGEVISRRLELLGISVIHDTTMHDAENFNYAYVYSAATVQRYLEEYPSIRYVLDIHRDSIFAPDGTCEKTLTYIDGKPTAQVMPVVGTNQNGSAHPDWKTNLTVATHLADLLGRFYPTLSRPINLRADGFNQWLSPGALIIEVGSCGNTLEEAKRAGELFATTFAVLLKENHENTIS